MKGFNVILFLVVYFNVDYGFSAGAMAALSPLDPSSYSRPELASIQHVNIKWNVDFKKEILQGSALLHFNVKQNIDEIVLDVRDQNITAVELDGDKLTYSVDGHLADFGSRLNIKLPKTFKPQEELKINISYSTSPKASALQWLEPSQTSGKLHPYLFSQCQPIHARSILPCQDTPAVKFTYDAELTAPSEFTVLMSALRRKGESEEVTKFSQPVPIPSYLIAIAVGVLESRKLGPRSLVWSEKEIIEKSAWEFTDTEKYLQAAEALCGPYVWGQYDLLVLPPSFPYGGMENPCLTFVTPTLIAGDRSQADVIIHEIMHSWTGNLVTNRNFEHFWLNEGFTVFLERKVAASLIKETDEAKKSRDFESILGLGTLKETINSVLGAKNPLTQLVVNLTSVHPDDAFSSVPYEKGSLFLRYLEDLVGGPEQFDGFMRSYLNEFKMKSLDTDQFKEFLLNYFKGNEALKQVDWDNWLYSPGMPPVIPKYDTSMAKIVEDVVAQMKTEKEISDSIIKQAKSFTPHQTIQFLQELIDGAALNLQQLRYLGDQLKFNSVKNTEILFLWLRICIKCHDKEKIDDALKFINSQGRMKYVRPIYRDLYAWPDVRELAVKNFLENESSMMHVSAYTLRKDLHLREDSVCSIKGN